MCACICVCLCVHLYMCVCACVHAEIHFCLNKMWVFPCMSVCPQTREILLCLSFVPLLLHCLVSLTGLVYDESSGVRHVRRMFHPGRGLGGPRARRTNMHFTSSSTGGLSSSQSSSYSPSNREAMDPIAGEDQRARNCPHNLALKVEVPVEVLPTRVE